MASATAAQLDALAKRLMNCTATETMAETRTSSALKAATPFGTVSGGSPSGTPYAYLQSSTTRGLAEVSVCYKRAVRRRADLVGSNQQFIHTLPSAGRVRKSVGIFVNFVGCTLYPRKAKLRL